MNQNNQNKIMITGGSSFVGRHLTARLSDNDVEITSVYHRHLPEPMKGVFPVCSDFSSADLLAAPLRDIETVYHLAWAHNFIGQSTSTNNDTSEKPLNLFITENLVHAMEKIGTKRIIFMSAIGAHKKSKHPFLREKYLAELCILNSKIPEKIIVRSAPICGGDGTSDRMTFAIDKILRAPLVYPIPESKKTLSPVHIDCISENLKMLKGFDLGGNQSLIFEMKSSQSFTVKQMFQNLAGKRGIRSKWGMGGFMGDTLTPLFDRVKKDEKDFLRLRDYLQWAESNDPFIMERNPVVGLLPQKIEGFEKVCQPASEPTT